MPVLYLPAY
jgi:hypothetical protein